MRNVLDEQQLARIRSGCETVIRKMVQADPTMTSNRGSHRYSFGSAPAYYGEHDAWSALIEPPVLHTVLRAIWGSSDFVCRGGAHSGGDFVLPGCVEYQPLHRDMNDFFPPQRDFPAGSPTGVTPPRPGRADWRDTPAPLIVCNFPMEVVQGSDCGHTAFNGATRQIPGTQSQKQEPPSLADEPQYMKLMTTAPAPAGTAMLRDTRAFHGGTPNLGQNVR